MNCLSCIVIGAAVTPAAQKELIDAFVANNGIEIKNWILASNGMAFESILALRGASPSDGAWHDPVVTAHLPSAARLMAERIAVFYCGAERIAPAVSSTPKDDVTTRIITLKNQPAGGTKWMLTK